MEQDATRHVRTVSGRTTALPSSTSQIVVIGGGVVGLGCARALAQAGQSVVVVERGEIGTGCSIASAGHLVPSHVWPLAAPHIARDSLLSLVRPQGALSIQLRPRTLRWVGSFLRHCRKASAESGAAAFAGLAALSVDELASVERDAQDLTIVRGGLLDVYRTSRGLARAAKHAETLREHGVVVELLDADQATQREPTLKSPVAGAVFFPDDALVHPSRLLAELERQATTAGAQLISGVDATAIRGKNGRAHAVCTSVGDIAAGHVVVAAGAWSAGLARTLGERLPVEAAQGSSVTFQRAEGSPRQAMLLGEDHVAVARYGNHLRLAGWFQIGNMSTAVSTKAVNGLKTLAARRLKLPPELIEVDRHAGLRPVTPDGLPLIGTTERWHNVTLATGHGMVGLTMGPGTGRAVAQHILGERSAIDLDRFNPARFHR